MHSCHDPREKVSESDHVARLHDAQQPACRPKMPERTLMRRNSSAVIWGSVTGSAVDAERGEKAAMSSNRRPGLHLHDHGIRPQT